MSNLTVCHNTIWVEVPTWNSARNMSVNTKVRSLHEVMRFATYTLVTRIEKSTNLVLTDMPISYAYLA